MDLFGTAHIRQLQEDLAQKDSEYTALASENRALKNQVEYLVRTIRQIDDKLFTISQCTDWTTMRPRINSLVDEMTARKVAESKRIGDLITRELHDTYKPESAVLKQITKGKS